MKHVIITGGAGFIGSHLCETFLEKGYSVTAVDSLLTGRKKNLQSIINHPAFRFVERDVSLMRELRDWENLEFVQRGGLAGLLHFACPASPVDFDKLPFEILSVDSLGTLNTLSLALKYNARYLLASTSEIYGDPQVHPQTEDYWGNVNSTGPRACYDEAKRFAEACVTTAIRGQGKYFGVDYQPLNGGIVRIFNTYGPRMRPDDGRVVPQLCIQGLKNENLTLHGDGKQTRSFCFVTDLVDGIVRLYESGHREPVNIGNPIERTVLDFAEHVQKLTGSLTRLEFLPARPDDPRKRCPDITRAKNILGWQPKVDLQEGLSRTLQYFKEELTSSSK